MTHEVKRVPSSNGCGAGSPERGADAGQGREG